MANQGITGSSRSNAPPISFQELRASENSIRKCVRSRKREPGSWSRSPGEAALLHHGQEQPHIRQIEAQLFSFGPGETTHRKWPIVTFGRRA